jgi:glycosyltransferase involved in cell wall biosynthesis
MQPDGPDLLVLTQDPAFRGGGEAQTRAFLAGVTALGRSPRLVFDPHPALAGTRPSLNRVEAVRQLRARRRLAPDLQAAQALWVVTTIAAAGSAAARSGRPYCSWVGTTIESEWRGRARGLRTWHRRAAALSLPVLRRLEREALKRSERLYATSPSSRRDVARAAGVPEDEIRLLPIPVETSVFRPADDTAWRAALEERRAVFVGRGDDPRKNLRLLIETAQLLPDVRFRLVGRPPVLALPANIEAAGEVDDVAAELRATAVFVLPSLQEGFGIVAAEALATGLPVATTPCGGPEELVRDSNGGLVARDFSPRALAEAIEGAFADAPALRDAGRAHIEREHSPERFRERLAAALADCP